MHSILAALQLSLSSENPQHTLNIYLKSTNVLSV